MEASTPIEVAMPQRSAIGAEMSASDIPSWVDEEASDQLPFLRSRGEGQSLEFMREFPKQAHGLAKEIAAFATSNAGIILLGVNDEGDCVGLENTASNSERDALLRRLEGICTSAVKPSITPQAKFALEDGRTVLVITIPKGAQPLYYVNNIPYVRHLTTARPAEPHEVIELVRGVTIPTTLESETDAKGEDRRIRFLADLMRTLIVVRIFHDEFGERAFNPWLDMWRAQYADVASNLREAAVDDIALDEKLQTALLDTAEALNQVATLTLHLGSGNELKSAADRAASRVENLLGQIAPEVIPHVDSKQILEQLRVISRQLALLDAEVMHARSDGNLSGVQEQATELGQKLLFVAQYGVNRLGPDLMHKLLNVGHRLHLAETHRVYLDGGTSANRILDEILQALVEFNSATKDILTQAEPGQLLDGDSAEIGS